MLLHCADPVLGDELDDGRIVHGSKMGRARGVAEATAFVWNVRRWPVEVLMVVKIACRVLLMACRAMSSSLSQPWPEKVLSN